MNTRLTCIMLEALLLCGQLVAIDGDTLDCDGERIRLANIDAPEVFSARCPAERLAGYRAALRLDALVADGATIVRESRDRYGRTLARVETEAGDVGEILVAEGHARVWTGRRRPWCE